METRVLTIERNGGYAEAVEEASACLARGGLVVFPTETVYGIGANAADPDAVARLREVKQRSDMKPFTVHIGARSTVDRFVPCLKGMGRRLTEKAWPGPLTLIFKVADIERAPVVKEISVQRAQTMYHEGTIGIRCPDDPVAADVLCEAGVPVVAASANPAGSPAPIDADEALGMLNGRVDLVLDAGRSRYAKASTIVRVDDVGYRIVREGVLDERTIRRLAHTMFLVVCSGNTCRSPMAAGLLKRLIAEKLGCNPADLASHGYTVESAGISACPGSPPTPTAVEALSSLGIDISTHRSQPLTLDLANRADYIFVMTADHAKMITALAPGAADRVRMIDETSIEDPIGGNEAVYRMCSERIENGLKKRLQEIVL